MSRNDAAFNFRVPQSTKTEAFAVIEQYGFTPSQVMNLFLTEIAKTKTVPLNLTYLKPNAVTLRSMKDAENGELEFVSVAENESLNQALLKL